MVLAPSRASLAAAFALVTLSSGAAFAAAPEVTLEELQRQIREQQAQLDAMAAHSSSAANWR